MGDHILRWQFFRRHPGYRPSVESHRQCDNAHTLTRGTAADFLPASDACCSPIRSPLLAWRERPRIIGRSRRFHDRHGDSSSSGLQQFIEGSAGVLYQVKAVGNLDRGQRTLACTLGIRLRSIPHDDLDARMGSRPRGERLRVSAFEEIDRSMGLKINQDGGVGLAATQGQIIDAEDAWGASVLEHRATEKSQQGLWADCHTDALRQT